MNVRVNVCVKIYIYIGRLCERRCRCICLRTHLLEHSYIRLHIHSYICMFTHTFAHTYTALLPHSHIHTHVCVSPSHIRTFTHMCVCLLTHSLTHMYVYSHIHSHIHVYTRIYSHINIYSGARTNGPCGFPIWNPHDVYHFNYRHVSFQVFAPTFPYTFPGVYPFFHTRTPEKKRGVCT